MKIQDLMVKDVVQILPDQTIRDAARRMREQSVGCLVVTSDESVRGIITDRDLLACLEAAHDPYRCKVSLHMSHPVIVERPEEDVATAADVMRRNQIKRLPVLRNGILVGIVSISDVAAVVHAEAEKFWPTWVLTTTFVRVHAAQGRGPKLNAKVEGNGDKEANSDGLYIRRPDVV
jgi:CBS domain-containing protein